MRRITRTLLVATALATGATVVATHAVPAQQAPASARAVTRPADEVLAQLGQNAGVVVLTDSTVYARLPATTGAATAEGVEQQLVDLVRSLPAGTTWVKLYMPTPVNGRWNGDIVADYIRAQARLLGAASRPAPAGMVEIFGRTVPADKAGEYATALNLKLVYLVSNPQAPSTAAATANWSRLSPEQRTQYAQQQAQQLMRLDPQTRAQAMRQMMRRDPTPQDMVLRVMMSQMSDDEKVQLKQSLAGPDSPIRK